MPKIVYTPAIGSLLVAEPFLNDPNFDQSVILLVSHGEEGSIGFNLSCKSPYTLREALSDFPKANVPLYEGGPVMLEHLYFLHTRPDLVKSSIPVFQNIFWGGDHHSLFKAIEQGYIESHEYKFFTGYSGWSPGQLEEEIKEKSWIVIEPTGLDLIYIPENKLWSEILLKLDGDYPLWAHAPKNPEWN